MSQPIKTQAMRIADVNLEAIKRGPNWEGERQRRIFSIRAEYETRTVDVLDIPADRIIPTYLRK